MRMTRLDWPLLLLTIAGNRKLRVCAIPFAAGRSTNIERGASNGIACGCSAPLSRAKEKPAQTGARLGQRQYSEGGQGVSVVGSTETPAPAPAEGVAAPAVSVENKGQLDAAIQQAKDKIADLEQRS
jgi:hypothetical protein